MQLLTYRHEDGLRLGVRTERGVVDVARAGLVAGVDAAAIPATMIEVIAGGPAAIAMLASLVAAAQADASLWLDESHLNIGPCVPAPGKIICIGLNYRRHAEESGMNIPKAPVLFSKFNNVLAAHGDDVPIPPDTRQMDYEAELALVIGCRGRHIAETDALKYVFGYFNANDISARDLQTLSGQWLLGKTPDGFLPIGPYLVTSDEVVDPHNLRVTCTVNGELRQDSNTGDLIFNIPQIISYISRYITLEPGDIISTGTPEGVALGRPDKPWLQPGDAVTIAINGLGTLTNILVAGDSPLTAKAYADR